MMRVLVDAGPGAHPPCFLFYFFPCCFFFNDGILNIFQKKKRKKSVVCSHMLQDRLGVVAVVKVLDAIDLSRLTRARALQLLVCAVRSPTYSEPSPARAYNAHINRWPGRHTHTHLWEKRKIKKSESYIVFLSGWVFKVSGSRTLA